ncbi:unnamed protein product, partial [Amoebophrya sp. A25]
GISHPTSSVLSRRHPLYSWMALLLFSNRSRTTQQDIKQHSTDGCAASPAGSHEETTST